MLRVCVYGAPEVLTKYTERQGNKRVDNDLIYKKREERMTGIDGELMTEIFTRDADERCCDQREHECNRSSSHPCNYTVFRASKNVERHDLSRADVFEVSER